LNKALLTAVAVLVALAAVVAGCGGSDDSDTSASLTKAQFVKQADAICVNSNKEIESEFESYAKEKGWDENKEPSKDQQEEAIVDVVAPNIQGQVDEIKDLGAPEGDEETIETMLAAVEEGVEELEENPGQLTEEGKNPLAKGSKLARDYGLAECGEE
jgi:hypothetical protein